MFCASCRRDLPSDARFCHLCGAPCAPAAVTVGVTGRKVVTVLFCDLVGSTALSGELDAETLRSVTLRWFDLMRRPIEDQGGTVEKFIGDAVMAVFGVPIVREDDARRAVAAALAMREALTDFNARLEAGVGVRLRMRIGINTGQAVTGASTARQAMVSGEVVNVAARLEQRAAAGEILIGPDTLRSVGTGIRTAEIGPLDLKGKRERVTAHRLLGLDEEDGAGAHPRSDHGFIGRARELAALDAALERVVRTRRPDRLVIAGAAGQGKTRLLREWLGRDTAVHGVGRCRARGEQASLGPLADAVNSALRRGGTIPPSPDLDLLEEGLLRHGTPAASAADICAALSGILSGLSATRPVVLVIDDCHWAAQPLFDILDQMFRALTDAAVLVVLLTRPQLLDTHPGLARGAALLGGLPDGEARALAAELSGTDPNGTEVAPHVLERAGGNPLHLEQLLLSEEDGTRADDVPLPLRALIGARIDALDPPERHVLGWAAVLGSDFTPEELAALTATAEQAGDRRELRATLRRLVRHRLISPDARAFRFAGGLVQEVVYDSQAKRDRAERHERAARLESVRRRGNAAVGAHLERAHRYRVELGAQDPHTDRLRREAADALAEAGRVALARADPEWAADLLSRAAARYEAGEPHRTATRRRLGQALIDLGRVGEARTLLEEVLSETRATGGDAVEAAHVRLSLASAGQAAAPTESPAEAARATLPVFTAARDHLGQARACLRLAQHEQERGRHGSAERMLVRALDHAAHEGGEPERAAALGAIGISLWRGPRPVAEALDRCGELLSRHGRGHGAVRLTLSCPLAVLLALHDDEEGARQRLSEAEEIAVSLGYAETDAFLPLFAATVADLAGRHEEALVLLDRAAAAARRLGAGELLRGILLDTARVRLDLGDRRGARATLSPLRGAGGGTGPTDPPSATGGAPGGGHGPRADAADLDGQLARIAAAEGDAETARRLARRACDAAAGTDSPIIRGLASLDLARTALALERPGDARIAAHHALRRFATKGHLPAVRRAESVLADCRAGTSRDGPRPGAGATGAVAGNDVEVPR
ncbi:AAA family ATPase [Streptomyces calidiresistens]|uniref:AAA family ATPase n=1 Tax=Streptomyces calidiresistens TaxID=1485586 RepID=A0A7W3T0T6_9ACTN|nr:adenylate/guanylate cyclase domain-containing protein [Streptomyces calidiresistens]MBB0228820.1 AAA family ATPase [Streptomyces calidiresistens]